MEALLASGHPDPWSYSIAQLYAFSGIAERRRKRELGEMTSASLLGSRGDPKKVAKLLKEWAE